MDQIRSEEMASIFSMLGYQWNPVLNLVAFRSTDTTPNKFNDYLSLYYEGGKGIKVWPVTTDPGTFWLENPMNVDGTFILKPGQYIDSHIPWFHHNRKDHRALVQRGILTGWRDLNKDSVLDKGGRTFSGDNFGVNIHGTKEKGVSKLVDKWSAGCTVHPVWANKEEMMDVIKVSGLKKITYNLIEEEQLTQLGQLKQMQQMGNFVAKVFSSSIIDWPLS